MGLFGTSNNNNSIPDLSRYDYHYRGSHVKGYNVESGANATAKQYVRSLSLTGTNGNNLHVKNYPQTRRTIKKSKKVIPKSAPVAKPHDYYIADSNRFKDANKVYDDNSSFEEEEDSYDVVDFDEHGNQYSQQIGEDEVHSGNEEDGDFYSQDRYNSITSVTTTTTTTTKEIDPVTGLETTTKTVETTLPDGTVKTTVIKVQKAPGNSRTSSRNNSLVGSPTKNGVKREFHQPMFNGFSSDQYNDEIAEEEEEYVQKAQQHMPVKRHRTNNGKKKLPEYAQNTPSTYSTVTPAAKKEWNGSPQRMTDAEMYARALEIAREKVMSDPSRIVAAQAATQKQSKWKNKKNAKTENVELFDVPQVGIKKHDIPRSLRDDGRKAAVASAVAASTAAVISTEDSNSNKSEVPLKKSKFNLFKMFKKDKSDKMTSQQEKTNTTNIDSNVISDENKTSNSEVPDLGEEENVITETVDDESESDIEFLPLDEEDKLEAPHVSAALPHLLTEVSPETNKVPHLSAKVSQTTIEVPRVSPEVPQGLAEVPHVSAKVSQIITEVPQVTTEVPQVTTEVPQVTTEVPRVATEVPQVKAEVSQVKAEVPQETIGVPSLSAKASQTTIEVPRVSAEVPRVSAEVPRVSAEVPRVSAEVPRVSAEVPRVSAEVPRVSAEVPQVSDEAPQILTKSSLPNTDVITETVQIPSAEVLGNVEAVTEPLTPHPTDVTADLRNHGTQQQIEKLPIKKKGTFVMASNTVVKDSDYAPEKDINEIEESAVTKKSEDVVDDAQTGEIVNDNGYDVTELYNDVPDPMSTIDLEDDSIEPDVSLLQDVPLLKTMQSENELRDALENLEEEDEVNVLKEIGNERNSQKNYAIKKKPHTFEERNYDESTDSLDTPQSGNIIDTLPEKDVTFNDARNIAVPDVKKIVNSGSNNRAVAAFPNLENKNTSTGVFQAKVSEEKTVVASSQLKPTYKQPVITLNAPVAIEKQRIEVLHPAEELQETLIPPIESDPEEAEQPLLFETTESQAPPISLTKPPTGESTSTKKKRGGFMSKIVQFSNENYGRQVEKPTTPLKAPAKTEKPKKQEKPEKKPSKWKLFKKT